MTMTVPYRNKPFNPNIRIQGLKDVLRSANSSWWLKRLPLFALALPSSYGVAAFAHQALPLPVAIFAGAANELAYIGLIAIADQQHDHSKATRTLWIVTNLMAVIASVLANLLFFAGGKYSGITPEVVTHALPYPVLGFFYALYLHLAERRTPHECKYGCGASFATERQLRGHYGQCGSKMP